MMIYNIYHTPVREDGARPVADPSNECDEYPPLEQRVRKGSNVYYPDGH